MSFLDEVRADRQPLADVLKKHRGIRRIVEDLYPDSAHFIYELLQNAVDAKNVEDIGATEASFLLEENLVTFEHNGRPFSKDDIWGITDIGEGTKAGDEDNIGRFGVGFKAVFAYSETPYIWSPSFSFMISELVLPTEIAAKPELGPKTRFEFPFNNPKKIAQDAYREIEEGLNELAETTLLFLSHLQSIRWQIGQRGSGEVLRIQHSMNHVEVRKSADGKAIASSHFLRFSEPVDGLEKQFVSVAFPLECLPNVTAFDPTRELGKQLKIIPANPGRVAVFFPAEKESAGLRFHLHAPFVPELSRASIKETPANDPLFKQLASLTAMSLHTIRDLNLLTSDFLGVLPNSQDTIPLRYHAIRTAVIDEMNKQPLTPTHSRSHDPAEHLLQGRAALKELLSEVDINFLVNIEDGPVKWAMGAAQKNSRVDRLLTSLAITDWDVSEFVQVLEAKIGAGDEPDKDFTAWLAGKPFEWHQQMYSLLYADLPASSSYRRKQAIDRLKVLHMIRLSNGRYSLGGQCYFPTDGIEEDELLPRVDKALYSSGNNKAQQEDSRKLLTEVGVREVGEVEEIEAILNQRYTADAFRPNLEDLERFVTLIEKDPTQSKLFTEYFIFERVDNKWGKPSQTYVDLPILDTGLSAYYDATGEGTGRKALSESYQKSSVPLEKLLRFAERVGTRVRLEVIHASCHDNPAVSDLVWNSPGGWSENYGINRDYTIKGLKDLLSRNSESLSRLIWKTASEKKDIGWLRAQYRNNSNHQIRESESQLVCTLRDSSWIPQSDGRFVLPSEASRELLPKGFPYDEGYEWLKAIRFGEEERKQSEEHKQKQASAKELGFSDADTLERAKRFVALPQAEQERILAEFQNRVDFELPEHETSHPERRAEHVAKQAADAPERITEQRSRSVSIGREDVKQEAEPYLREQYTNSDGHMICQICQVPLPFRLDDGRYYFEKVEFLEDLTRRHYQNYLALCPNHSAMFQHANGSRDAMKEILAQMVGQHLEVILAQADATIYFTKTHIADLRAVIEADEKAPPEGVNETELGACSNSP